MFDASILIIPHTHLTNLSLAVLTFVFSHYIEVLPLVCFISHYPHRVSVVFLLSLCPLIPPPHPLSRLQMIPDHHALLRLFICSLLSTISISCLSIPMLPAWEAHQLLIPNSIRGAAPAVVSTTIVEAFHRKLHRPLSSPELLTPFLTHAT
ncbi:hypothetical protein BJ322DRAFT_355365 [Thelephora terrestris]|uniref:Uncharacterized protein n=1 Tax=Thelephora terrestris TaxID=56493 RepID=A0A9P6H6Z4_9AGAM|nr:hypothetical protein BJ322DRAFT_355365 [Thelephora terrestris]